MVIENKDDGGDADDDDADDEDENENYDDVKQVCVYYVCVNVHDLNVSCVFNYVDFL